MRKNPDLPIYIGLGIVLILTVWVIIRLMPEPKPDPQPGLRTTSPLDGASTTDSGDNSLPVILEPIAAVDSFREFGFTTYTLSPHLADIRLFNPKEGGGVHTFSSLNAVAQAEEKSLAFAMNGGMYEADRSAQGLLIINGLLVNPIDTSTSGYGNFYLQPNGIFALNHAGEAFVIPTQKFDSLNQEDSILYATQSGPLMVNEGRINPLFNDGSPNRHIRNAVGTTPDGTLVFGISHQTVTFFELSSLMIEKGCTQVLYLDGFVSRMFLPAISQGSLIDGEGLGPLIAVFQ